MENNYDDIILLERYIEHSLTEDEIYRVEKRLANEPTFKELYKSEKLLVNGIRYGHLKGRLDQLKSLEATLPAITSSRPAAKVIFLKSYWKQLAVAASLILSVISYLILNRPTDPGDLYAEYFQPYPNIILPKVRGTQEQNQETDAISAYENHDYEQAARGFREILATKPEPGILLLLGNANLILGNTDEALENFITLSKDFNEFDIQAKWFQSLCYLKKKDVNSAKLLLEEIAAGDSSYKSKAKEVLKKLR